MWNGYNYTSKTSLVITSIRDGADSVVEFQNRTRNFLEKELNENYFIQNNNKLLFI
jgi:hypothetical protein